VTIPSDRPPPKRAGPDLLVLAKFEEFTGWLLDRTAKWPKSARYTWGHHIFDHPDGEMLVNLQEVAGEAKPCQIREFLRLVERYSLRVRGP